MTPKITLASPDLFQEKTPKFSQKSGITNHLSRLYKELKNRLFWFVQNIMYNNFTSFHKLPNFTPLYTKSYIKTQNFKEIG